MGRSLKEKRIIFTKNVAELILYAKSIGYDVAGAYLKRCENCKVGKKKSEHKNCLAIDLDLYINGVYQTSTDSHAKLGAWWKARGGIWGGDFNDGNHYEYGNEMT